MSLTFCKTVRALRSLVKSKDYRSVCNHPPGPFIHSPPRPSSHLPVHPLTSPSIYPFIKYLLSLSHILCTLSKLLTGHWGAGWGHEPYATPACSSQFRNRESTLNRQTHLRMASICQQGRANELMSECICISHTHTFQIQKKPLTCNRMISH